jgi:hypothetical protein
MADKPNYRGRLLAVLIAAMVAAAGNPVNGISSAEEAGKESGVLEIRTGAEHAAYVIGYPDGTIGPLKPVTREETAVIFYRLMQNREMELPTDRNQPFTDVDGKRWSFKEIAALYQAKILLGNPDGSFQPDRPVTRAEFAAISARFDKLFTTEENMFPDIKDHWAEQYIISSTEKGWIKGYGDGTFRPEDNIIRCEVMMRINEALDRRVNHEGLLPDAKQWPDNTPDKWYYEIILEAATTHDYERADKPRSTEKWTKVKGNPVW